MASEDIGGETLGQIDVGCTAFGGRVSRVCREERRSWLATLP